MKKKLTLLFLFTVIISLTLGSEPAVYSASEIVQGTDNKITFTQWGASFQLPSSKWSAIGEFNNEKLKKTIFSYRREPITNKAGTDVMANISFIFEKVNYIDINAYSPTLLGQVPMTIKNKFTAGSGLISLKNAIGYLGVSKDAEGIEHTIVLVHGLSTQKGMQVIMDIPSELYPKVKGEFNAALKSLRFK